jgi:phage tail P2-like protein
MTDVLQDLLPSSASPLQITLSLVDAQRYKILGAFPTLKTLLSPQDTPANMLPYLAYQRSVATWDSAWPEAIKRNVIEAAYEVHRHKGTVYAVKTALAALGVNAFVTEWWQTLPRGYPYTFEVETFSSVELYAGEQVITPRVAKAIQNAVAATKPVTRDFTFAVGALSTSDLGLAGALSATQIPEINFDWLEPEANADLAVIAVLTTERSVQFEGVN